MLDAEEVPLPCARVVLMDTITKVGPEHAGAVVISGSHGGRSSGAFALTVPLRLAVFNDAGIGKENAGIVALAMLQAAGMPAVAVSHLSARIGDARDGWEHGVISRINEAALNLGLREGQHLQEAVRLLSYSPPRPP